ncbi:cation diffusion facilitator family transporter [Thiopseudomonas acetoxidans]|uniref:Cation diffusion facilitator family transporter n=1 Tax=Thiopseudomonas acetoxidans TaxID=3041622 RepID=A0ABT7SMJ2_9GAMM|nr:cation diffusion facilitator family transporter [Thiopseudomonas sp. CY1220]MDM7857409.1 cation diffusion facilitator family transporter [Thiopseudomonas sp. CY1220]
MSSKKRAKERQKAMRRTSLVGAVVNLALTIGKVIFGIVGQSHALIADGVHSLADLSTDLMVWFAAKYSNQPADEDHPYGHARIETMFTVALGVVLIVTSVGIAWDSAERLLNPSLLLQPTPIVLLIAFISILANEGLYQYTMIAARKHRSSLLKANAWHHRSDAISSVVVLLGVAGSLLGLTYLDAFAAAVVAFMIAKIGWEQAWNSIRELIDTGLDAKQVSAIKKLIKNIDGVHGVHMLRTRRMGGSSIVDVHIQVDDFLSVSEGHRISEHVRHILLESNKDIVDVVIHIDPEDDEVSDPSSKLPLRSEVLKDLRSVWQEDIEYLDMEKVVLHYLNGQIHIEVFDRAEPAPEVSERLVEKAQQLTYVGRVSWYCPLSRR